MLLNQLVSKMAVITRLHQEVSIVIFINHIHIVENLPHMEVRHIVVNHLRMEAPLMAVNHQALLQVLRREVQRATIIAVNQVQHTHLLIVAEQKIVLREKAVLRRAVHMILMMMDMMMSTWMMIMITTDTTMTVIMQTVWTTKWMSLDGIEKEKGTSMSAGRLYDKIGDKAKGKIIAQGGDPEQYYSQNPAWTFANADQEMWAFSQEHIGELIWSEILPRLKALETQTWGEILVRDKKQNHSLNLDDLNKVAQDILAARYIEAESLIFLRVTGNHRLYGYMSGRVFNILWYDDDHGDNNKCVCRSRLKHT